MQSVHATPQIFAMGRIVKASNFEDLELFVKWEIISGSNFKLIEGNSKGETFLGNSRLEDREIYFDHPFNFNLSCRSIKGWPKFLFEVWGTDQDSRNRLLGYGTTFLPFKTGNMKIDVPCWRPTESINESTKEFFLGNTAEFVDKSAVYSVDEKFGMNSISTGSVTIEIDIIMKDFGIHGIQVG